MDSVDIERAKLVAIIKEKYAKKERDKREILEQSKKQKTKK